MSGRNPPGNELLRAALYYAGLGWSIIRIKHRDASGKQPVGRWKPFQETRPSRSQLERWFRESGLDGLAVVLGPVSGGLHCRDFDRRESYDAWAEAQPELANQLPTVETARGMHVYFRANLAGTKEYGDGELRGKLCYCLLPPSKHPAGHVYRWLRDYDLANIPEIDPFSVGLGPPDTERTERTEDNRGNIRERDTQGDTLSSNHGSVLSALSVLSVPQEELIAQAIEATQPKDTGQRNLAIFRLARALKGIPPLADAPVASLRPIVLEWHRRALPVIGTKPFEDTWFDFTYGWKRVRFPAGQDPFDEIV